MYCDPVTCVCFTAENTYMIIASCFRSFLEHQISGLCICLSYHVCFLPLIGSSVAYSFPASQQKALQPKLDAMANSFCLTAPDN